MPSDGVVVDPTLERAEPGTHSCLRVPLLKVALVMLTLVKCLFLWPYGKVMTDCQVVLTPASQRLLLRCPCNRRVPQCLRFVMMLLRLRIGQPGQPARHRLEPGEPSAPPIAPETNDEDMSADPEAKRKDYLADLQTKALKADRIRYLLHEFKVRDECNAEATANEDRVAITAAARAVRSYRGREDTLSGYGLLGFAVFAIFCMTMRIVLRCCRATVHADEVQPEHEPDVSDDGDEHAGQESNDALDPTARVRLQAAVELVRLLASCPQTQSPGDQRGACDAPTATHTLRVSPGNVNGLTASGAPSTLLLGRPNIEGDLHAQHALCCRRRRGGGVGEGPT
eukprot:s2873_g14.t1